MQLSPRTNITLAEIASRINGAQSFALCGHVSPDGDCLGSQLALASALRALGKEVHCLLAKADPPDPSLSYMEGFEELAPASEFASEVDLFIALDVPTRERLADAAVVLDRARSSITIDHHESETTMTEFTFADPSSASCSLLVWDLIGLLGVSRTASIATCAYTGLMTDTGRFQYQNADALCFAKAAEMVEAGALPHEVSRAVYQNRTTASVLIEAVAIDRMLLLEDGKLAMSWLTKADFERCGATKADAEPIIDILRSIRGISVACMLREQDGVVRGSLRAKDDADVASVAREYGGGGHKAAAGFSLDMAIDEAVETMKSRLSSFVAE
ncbi:MAG: DHH family phosphoesterase [Eggerthellaceae bacterium]|nr:DHH family phosphoesterase [Eggerthellaceae bacterium]